MPKKTKDVRAALIAKGFVERQTHHTFFHLYVEGKKTDVSTKVSHGAKEIADGLLGAMARQTRLVRREFLQLVECPLTAEQYLELLRERGVIEAGPAEHDKEAASDEGNE